MIRIAFDLAPSFYGIVLSVIVFVPVSLLSPQKSTKDAKNGKGFQTHIGTHK